LTRAVQRALNLAPFSLRALARQANVPHTTLVFVLQGKREATEAVAEALEVALCDLHEACGEAYVVLSRERKRLRKRQPKGGTR
jgi:predicted transcriptional regulator